MSTSNIPEFKLNQDQLGAIPFKLELFKESTGYNPRAPHRHNYYELFFFEKGGGIHMIDFNEFEIEKGHIHILSPGQVHFIHRSPQSKGLVIKFTPDFFLANIIDKDLLHRIPFLNNKVSEPLIKPNSNEFDSLLFLVKSIQDEYEKKGKDYEDIIRHYLNLILLKCHRLYDYKESTSHSPELELTNNFKTLLEKFYLEQNRVSFYSNELRVSEDKLSSTIKKITGYSPSEMISNRLLLEAKRWLLHSNISIKEIAFHLNFQDQAYFNRWFKKAENYSPGEFRTVKREKYKA